MTADYFTLIVPAFVHKNLLAFAHFLYLKYKLVQLVPQSEREREKKKREALNPPPLKKKTHKNTFLLRFFPPSV